MPEASGHAAAGRRCGVDQDRADVSRPEPAFAENTPGLNRNGAEFLAQNGAIMIGADNLTLERVPTLDPDNWLPVHTYLLAEAAVVIMEMAFLDEIAAEKVYEFAFFGACIKLRGATGSPMRPVAMPLAK